LAEMRHKQEWYTLYLLTAIALLAFLPRIAYLDQKSIWWDESTTLNHIRYGFSFILTNQMKWGENLWLDNHLPLYFVFMFLFVKFAGTSDFAIRYPSAAWGVLLVVLLYSVGKTLVNKQVGILAALVGALSPFYIWFSQSARMHILVPLLGLLSVYLLWRILRGKPWPWHLAFIVTNAALLFTNILGLSVMLFEGLVVVFDWLKRRNWRVVLTFAIASLTALPVVWFGLSRAQRSIRQEMLPFSVIFKDVFHSYDAGLTLDAPKMQWWDWVFFSIFVLGMLVLVERDRSRRVRSALFLGGYVLVTFLVLYAVPPINRHYMGSRYAVIGSPAFYLLLATGLETLRTRIRWSFVPAFGLVLAIFEVSTFRYFFVPPYTLHRGHDYRSAAEYVNAHAYPGDAIVGSPYSYDAFYRYSDPRLPWHGLPRRPYWDEETFTRETAPELEALKAEYARIWFIDADYLYVEQNRGVTEDWLDRNCVQFAYQPYAYVTVVGYLTRSPFLDDWPEIESPLDVAVEDVLRIEGYVWDDPRPQSGERTRFTLYMQAQRDLEADYGVAIRLRDEQGRVWSSKLQPILAGIRPTSQWRSGERFTEFYDLEITPGTPPGAYQAELGLYRIAPYRDLIVYTPAKEAIGTTVLLGQIVVQPRVRQLPADAPSGQRRLNARLGRNIDLIGLDASVSDLQAGKVVPFVLYLQARSTIESDYTARYLLMDDRGEVVWGTEAELVSPTYPTSLWRPGELLRGVHECFVPPHIPGGHYRLAVQLLGQDGQKCAAHRPRWNPWPASRLVLFDLDVRAREYSIDFPDIPRPLPVGVGEWGELLGYDLEADVLSPGEQVRFTLYWLASRPVIKGYKVFVHIVGQDGHMGAQKDSMPANWSRPTYTWVPGEPIVDAHEVPLPADTTPGEYDIVIGLYDEKSGQRVMLCAQGSDASDHLVLSSLRVE
jgi:hypothetical protein